MIDQDLYTADTRDYRPVSGIFFLGTLAAAQIGLGILIGYWLWS